jgi:hypothetical protein
MNPENYYGSYYGTEQAQQQGMYVSPYYAPDYSPSPFYQSHQFWKGFAIGAIGTLLVTNEKIQKAVMKGVVKVYGAIHDGAQELKEKFEDVQAELRRKEQAEE